MYDRASRDVSRPLQPTVESVGPGSYELPSFLHARKGAGKHGQLYLKYKYMPPCCFFTSHRLFVYKKTGLTTH